jgi:transcriptional regulator with XRE-family HTH domain
MLNVNSGGEFVRALRNNKGRTLKEIAESLDISQMYLSDIERGKRGITDELIEGLSEVFNIAAFELYMAFDKMPPIVDEYLLENRDLLELLYNRAKSK